MTASEWSRAIEGKGGGTGYEYKLIADLSACEKERDQLNDRLKGGSAILSRISERCEKTTARVKVLREALQRLYNYEMGDQDHATDEELLGATKQAEEALGKEE